MAALNPRPVRFLESVGSTNDIASGWLAEGALDGALVISDEQTAGRGRLGRTWFAPPGTSILMSLILRPPISALPRMTMLGGVAVCEAARELGLAGAGIKWANDVQIGGRKLCGVLPEANWTGSHFDGVILGIGVNVNVDFADSPYADTATSFMRELGSPQDRLEILQRILARLDAWRNRLETGELFNAWRANLNMLGQYVVLNGQRCFAEDVDRDGALLIRDESGGLQRVVAGDIGVG